MGDPQIGTAETIRRLREEFGYPASGARLIAGKLGALSPPIRAAFVEWWRTGTMEGDLIVEGYTQQRLAEEHGMNPIAAFLTLDWLTREPVDALASLARGHDRIAT
jgi:hypothetical protein